MLTLHVLSMVFSLGVVFKADKEALGWMRGKKPVLNPRRMRVLHVLTWSGLLALIITGSILSYPMLSFLLSQPLFIIKLLFVAILLVNGVLIGRIMHVAETRTFASLSWGDCVPLFTSGALSSLSWIGALIMAFILFS